MIKQLAHICINARDLEETAAFYEEGLGMERHFDFKRKGEWFGYYLRVGANTFIEVFNRDPGEVGNINHVALEVSDMEAVLERLRKFGAEVTEKKLGADNSWQAWTEDPNGVRIEFHEYTSTSSQVTGQACEVNW